MKAKELVQIAIILAIPLGGAAVAISRFMGPDEPQRAVEVVVPQLSPAAAKGRQAFAANCAQCHGENAAGSQSGPPLVHDIYNPGHHGDAAFYRAVQNGVQQHHWRFGNMPPRPDVSRQEVADILAYVRALQRANGILYREHRM